MAFLIARAGSLLPLCSRLPRLVFASIVVTLLLWSPRDAMAQCTASAPCAGLTNLGTLPGGADAFFDGGRGVSDNGTFVAGASTVGADVRAFRWSAGGMIDLGTLPGGSQARATGISGDGSVVVGYGHTTGGIHAFRWVGGVMADLGTFGGALSVAFDVNRDGSVVVGTAMDAGGLSRAFRWQGGVMADLGLLPGGSESIALSVSNDGSAIAGYGDNGAAVRAFRWSGGVMTDLGTLGGGDSMAYGISGNGLVVVGQSNMPGNTAIHAFRWAGGVMSDLQTLGGTISVAYGTNDDGSIVVGRSYPAGDVNVRAFRWTAASGMQDLNTLLANAGVNMGGITLTDARSISRNGQFIAAVDDTGCGCVSVAYLVRYYDGDAAAPIAGLTTASSVQQSINELANNRFGVSAQHHGLVAPLLGGNQPIEATNQAGVYAAFGSFSAGGYARYAFGNGFSLLGGIGYSKETYPEADLTYSASLAGAVRYSPTTGSLRPFFESGGWTAPSVSMSFSRTYANGAGTATGVGDTTGKLSYLYARTGLILDHARDDQIVLSAEYGRQNLSTGAYEEAFTAQNPFNAIVSSGTDRSDLVKARLQWTHRFGLQVDATLWGAAAWGFNRSSDMNAGIMGVGTFVPTALDKLSWAEYGLRVGYKFTDALALDVFANGVSGQEGIGTRTHAGLAFRVQY